MRKQLVTLIASIFLITIGSFAWSAPCSQHYKLISDFDDTVKRFHSKKYIRVRWEAIMRRRIYAGMDILYREMVKASLVNKNADCGDQQLMAFISGSPEKIRGRIEKLLKKHHFPTAQLFLNVKLQSKEPDKVHAYKMAAINQAVSQTDAPIILIGDTIHNDPEIFHHFQQTNPGRVLAVYIHEVYQRPLGKIDEEGNVTVWYQQIKYLTAFDIAINEVKEGRLDRRVAIEIGEKLLYEFKVKNIISPLGHCPTDLPDNLELSPDAELDLLKIQLAHKIQGYCLKK